MTKTVVVGAGFAGIATAWNLRRAGCEVTVMDPNGLGGGASGVSPGLLHPYPGPRARPAPQAQEAMAATLELLQAADHQPRPGILRIPSHPEQNQHFRECAKNPDVDWQDDPPGILIRSGLTIDPIPYLSGLWPNEVEPMGDLADFDIVIRCMGAATPGVKITPIKGQILKLEWPADLPPPANSIIGKKYLVMCDDNQACLIGATYERHFNSPAPDLETAKKLILPDICELYPQLASAKVLDVRAGLRASPPGHYPPIITQTGPKEYAFTGLGSRGLLYHALWAQHLIRNLVRFND